MEREKNPTPRGSSKRGTRKSPEVELGDRGPRCSTAPEAARQPEYKPPQIRMNGFTAPDTTPWVHVELVGATAGSDERADAPKSEGVWIRLEDWADDAGAAKRRLRSANIHLFGDAMKRAILEAQNLEEFPARPLIERPGWTEAHFALPSGEVFSPPGSGESVVLFPKHRHRCDVKRAKDWRKRLARLAVGQPIIEFALMVPFAGPLLRLSPVSFNPGFELVGAKRKGKSTLQQLAASMAGPAAAQNGRNYVIPANTTVNALEELIAEHADLPLIIEEMALYYGGENDALRARKMLELIMRLASGSVKARRGEPTPSPARFVYLTSSNEALADMFGSRPSQTYSAAGDRLLTIPIRNNRKHGIFDRLPKGCDNGKDAIRMMVRLIEDHHGHPMRRFLKQLVAARAADETVLAQRIQAFINEFREAVGVDENVGSESSIADVFGLVYAAGRLAQEYGALPRKLQLRSAVVRVHGYNRARSAAALSPIERLHRLAYRKGVLHTHAAELKEISDAKLTSAPAILHQDRTGKMLLLLTDEALNRSFALKKQLFKDPDVRAIMLTDKDNRKKLMVSIRSNRKQERLYAFAMPQSVIQGTSRRTGRAK